MSSSATGFSISSGATGAPLMVALSVVFLNLGSIGSIFFNKAILSHYAFRFPFVLLLFHLVLDLIALLVLKLFRVIEIPSFTVLREKINLVVIAASFWTINVIIGLYALIRVNIPMFSTLRRLNILFVMAGEYIFLNKRFSNKILFSIFVLVAGSVMSAIGDLTFDFHGYSLVFLNNLITAVYFNSIKKALVDLQLDALQLFYVTVVVAIPFVTLITVFSGQLMASYQYLVVYYAQMVVSSSRSQLGFVFASLGSAVFAFLVNFGTNWATDLTSPLTTAVAAQVKNFIQTLLGMFSWGYQFTWLNAAGLVVAAVGGVLYTAFKMEEKQKKQEDNPPESKI